MLGRGGYGTVFEAFDRERGERVAVKQLHRTSPRALASFKREFRTLSGIVHPGLPRLHDLFVRGDDWFFSMELVDGDDLSTWGRSDRVASATDVASDERSVVTARPITDLAIARARRVLQPLLVVLDAVHASGFVHCDVKPSNVRLRGDGRPVLLDFGLARALSEDADHFAGTLAYAAPEQLLGVVSPACDLYALGALVFELLTGGPPFGTGREAAENKQRRDAPSLEGRLPRAEASLAALVGALLSRSPEERVAAARPLVRTSPRRLATPFVGRVEALKTIERALEGGGNPVIVIEGDSGIGKSTLLAEVRERATRRGFVVLSGRASEREHVPFNVLDGVADGLAALREVAPHMTALGRTFPILRSSAPAVEAESADALADAFRATLHALGPTVLLLDDVQWADADCERLLAAVLAPPAPPPAAVIFARRPGGGLDHSRLLQAAVWIELGPLSVDETREFIVARGRSDREAATLAQESNGHPLFVEELLHARRPTINEAIRARFAALDPDALDVLRTLALATEPIGAPTVANVVERPHLTVTTVLDALIAARLVRRADQGERPRFTVFHDRIGELLRADTSDAVAAPFHAALARTTTSAAALCHHLEALGQREEAARAARVAADRAQAAMAFETEAWFCAREIALSAEPHDALRLRRAHALRRAGLSIEAAHELVRVAATSPEGARLRADAARLYLAAGEIERGSSLLESHALPRTPLGAKLVLARERIALRVERRLGLRGEIDHAELSGLQALAEGLGMTDNLRGAIFHTRAVRLGLRSSDALLRGELLAIEAIFEGASGRKGRRLARRLLAEAVAPFGDSVPARLSALVDSANAVNERCQRPSHANLVRFQKCEAFFEANGDGDMWILWSLRISRARGARILGDLNAMRALFYPLLAKADAQADLYARVTLRRGHIGLHLAADRPDLARETLATTRWPGQPGAYHIQDWLDLEGRLETDLYERRRIDLSPLEWRRLRRSSLHHSDLHRVLHRAMLGRVLLVSDRSLPRVVFEVRRVVSALAREREGYALAWARAIRAGLAMKLGDRAGALRELRAVRRLAIRYELMSLGASTQLVLSHLTTGEERANAERAAKAFHHEHGVRNPYAWVGIAYPTFRA